MFEVTTLWRFTNNIILLEALFIRLNCAVYFQCTQNNMLLSVW